MSRKYTTHTDGLKRTILETLAKNNMSVTSTAKELHYCRTNIQYHLYNIHQETGLNPQNFYDLIELLEMYGIKTVYNGHEG